MTRAELLLAHHRLSDARASNLRVLGTLTPQERQVKVETFLSVAGSDKVRTNAADQASLHLSKQILETRYELDALTTEIEDVRIQLGYTE